MAVPENKTSSMQLAHFELPKLFPVFRLGPPNIICAANEVVFGFIGQLILQQKFILVYIMAI